MVKGDHECLFVVSVDVEFVVKRKRGYGKLTMVAMGGLCN